MEKMRNSVSVDIVIAEEKIVPTFVRGNAKFFDFNASCNLLRICKKKKIGILGIEGFSLENGYPAPQYGWIADFSKLLQRDGYVDLSINAAHQFLRLANADCNAGSQLIFEYVFHF